MLKKKLYGPSLAFFFFGGFCELWFSGIKLISQSRVALGQRLHGAYTTANCDPLKLEGHFWAQKLHIWLHKEI